MSNIDTRVSELLDSPLGCAFLLSVKASGLTPEAAVAPPTSFRIAAHVEHVINRWRSDHEAIVKEVLELGQQQEPLARAILERAESAWWFGPPDLDHQLWVSYSEGSYDETPPGPASWSVPRSPPTRWERYAQKLQLNNFTSTLIGGDSSLLMARRPGTAFVFATQLSVRMTGGWCLTGEPPRLIGTQSI